MSAAMDLTCEELVELVTDYIEGALSDEDRARFEQHLASCEGCVAYVEQMRATVALTGRLRSHDLPRAVRDGLLNAFRNWRDVDDLHDGPGPSRRR